MEHPTDADREGRYTVKHVAERVGLTPHQIRLWERRYHLLDPARDDNGYRLYSEEDVRVLSWIRGELERGVSLAVLAARPRDLLVDSALAAGAPASLRSPPAPQATFDLTPLVPALRRGDARAFERLLQDAERGLPFLEAVRTVHLPLLADLGALTLDGSLSIAGEHLATATVRRRLLHFIHALGHAPGPAPVVLAGAPADPHEVGLLGCMAELARADLPVLYLGPSLPVPELAALCAEARPRAVLVGVASPLALADAQQLARELGIAVGRAFPLALGGFEALRRRAVFERAGLTVLSSVADVTPWLSGLAPPPDP